MNITFVILHGKETCRGCKMTSDFLSGDGYNFEEAELRLHEALEAENWTDGLCPDCAEKRFLDSADKADHDNKIQRELDP